MTNRLLRFAITSATYFMIAASGTALAEDAAPGSLIKNGDFETLQDGLPVGWLKQNTDNQRCETEGVNHFLRLRITEPGASVMVYRLVTLPAKVQTLEFSFRVRYEDIKVGEKTWFDGRVMMNFKNAEGKIVTPPPHAPAFRGTSKEWQERKMTITVPEGAVKLEIMPTLFHAASGVLDFDDLSLKPSTPGAQ